MQKCFLFSEQDRIRTFVFVLIVALLALIISRSEPSHCHHHVNLAHFASMFVTSDFPIIIYSELIFCAIRLLDISLIFTVLLIDFFPYRFATQQLPLQKQSLLANVQNRIFKIQSVNIRMKISLEIFTLIFRLLPNMSRGETVSVAV